MKSIIANYLLMMMPVITAAKLRLACLTSCMPVFSFYYDVKRGHYRSSVLGMSYIVYACSLVNLRGEMR
jgi:hypothetical protein